MKHKLALLTTGILSVSMAFTCMAAEAPAGELPDIYSVAYGEAFDGPAALVTEGEVYISDALRGASAIYISGGEYTFDDVFVYGAGNATEEDLSAERSNQYGYCADVLTNGYGTVVTLNNPVIMSDPESYANGVFAAAMSEIYVNGGQIYTNNPQGHGVDATYMGRVYLKDTVIHTAGSASGSLATDYGGGFIQAENIDCTTELAGSPGIYCAGSSIIMCKNSTFTALNCEGVMSAHDHGITVLEDCTLFGEPCALNGHQAMPSPETSTGSYCFVFGGSLESGSGPIVREENGRTETTIVGTECILGDYDYVIEVKDESAGILTVNLWDTELTGNLYCPEGTTLTVNLYEGSKLTGEVEGTGTAAINVYPGGTYEGSFAAAEVNEEVEKPAAGDFDYYLVEYWAAGMQKWTGSAVTTYIDAVQPIIAENSAVALITDGAAATEYDPETIDISENGVDPSLLDTTSASGFGDPGASGGSEGESAEGESAEGESAEGVASAEGEAPAEDAAAPAEEAPVEEAPAEEAAPEGESPEGESPEGESPEGESPAEEAPVEEAPAEEAAAEETAEGAADADKWAAYIQYLNDCLDLDPDFELYEQIKGELTEAKQEDYHGMEDGTLYGAMQHSYNAVSFEEFEIGQALPDITAAIGIG